MPLDSASTRTRAVATNEAPEAIAAFEYHEASLGMRAAETRRVRAHAAAVRAGVLPDHLKHPMPVGTNEVVYADHAVSISVLVYAPIVGLDHGSFVADLLKAGVKPALIKRLMAKHTTETRPAHKFITAAVTE
jgi:hypothetical protein